jgi:hypothetical protein
MHTVAVVYLHVYVHKEVISAVKFELLQLCTPMYMYLRKSSQLLNLSII